MKVLQINSVCGVGSTGRIATDIHNILIEQGHESYIAYGRDISKNCDSAIKIGINFDNYTHVALTRLYDKHGFGSKKATKKFISKLEEIDPDVIHLHNIHGYYINIELLFDYLKKADKPVIWTLHDCWPFTGHCSHFDYIGCNKWENGCNKCPQQKEYPSSYLVDNSGNNYLLKQRIFTSLSNLTIVTPSQWLARLVKESFLKKYSIKVINNGIDLDVFKPTESDFRKRHNLIGKFIILGVASIWSEKKGFNYFLELSKKINPDEKIVLIGVNEKQKQQLPSNIIGITKTNDTKELAELYTEADVFVNPSLEENFPTTNLEALACGTPVITFDAGGSIESVDKDCGFIVPKGDLHGLINAIAKTKKNLKLQLNNSYFCVKRVEKFYNKNDRYKDYMEIYTNVCK